MINLYWPVYKSIEEELLQLSNAGHFDDKQLSIYSVRIGDLLVRTSIEIEAISKELYTREGGIVPNDRDLYFDTDCLNFLEEKWCLSKKQLFISSPYFYFQQAENIVLTPLHKAHKRGSSSCGWKRAYQAVKHNRTENLTSGNLKNLIHSLGALFILNVYLKAEKFTLGRDAFGAAFPPSLGSAIFSTKLHEFKGQTPDSATIFAAPDFAECIYYVRYDAESAKFHQETWENIKEEQIRLVKENISFQEYCKSHDRPDINDEPLLRDILGEEYYQKLSGVAIRHLEFNFRQLNFEATLNVLRCSV